MQTLEAARVDVGEVATLSRMAQTLPEASPLRDFLTDVVDAVRDGEDISVVANEQLLSPALAAKMLGVSRVHVYKLMDRGDLHFVRVGNDRRTTLTDIAAFQQTQDPARREMARRAAHPHSVRRDAASEI